MLSFILFIAGLLLTLIGYRGFEWWKKDNEPFYSWQVLHHNLTPILIIVGPMMLFLFFWGVFFLK